MGIIPALLLFFGILFGPETPRWLYAKGHIDKAREVLRSVRQGRGIENELREIAASVVLPRRTQTSTWKQVFSGVIMIGILLAVFQQVTGINAVLYYAPSIFSLAGFTEASGQLLNTIGIGVINLLATILAFYLIDRVGRRPLLLVGLFGMAATLCFLVYFFTKGSVGGVMAITLLAYVAFFAIGLGPGFWLLAAEIFPLHIRAFGMGIATMSNWLANALVTTTFPVLRDHVGANGTLAIFAFLRCWHFSLSIGAYLKPRTKALKRLNVIGLQERKTMLKPAALLLLYLLPAIVFAQNVIHFPQAGSTSAPSGRHTFRFGAATAATQIEDQNTHTDWYIWTAPPPRGLGKSEFVDDAVKGYSKAMDDIRLLQDLHLDTYRFGIEWARIEPRLGYFDEKALKHYDDFINGLLAAHIIPVITLHHNANPIWVDDPREPADCPQGPRPENLCGFANPKGAEEVLKAAGEYACMLGKRYGDRVDDWLTINEPMNYLMSNYGGDGASPGRNVMAREGWQGLSRVLQTLSVFMSYYMRTSNVAIAKTPMVMASPQVLVCPLPWLTIRQRAIIASASGPTISPLPQECAIFGTIPLLMLSRAACGTSAAAEPA